MVNFSKPVIKGNPQKHPQEIQPIIPLERLKPQGLHKGKDHTYTLCKVSYNTNSPTYDPVILHFDSGTIDKWLKF
eukprot:4767599-Ditylum_brightwellii.AAC.1